MVLDDIVGQKNAKRSIKNAIASKRVAHAYLFCGPDGVGKSIAASIFASTLNCQEKGLDPCGRCPSCIKWNADNHPDIIHFGASKHLGSRQSISVDEIRNLQIDMNKKPYEDGKKVYIIHDADKMTEQAQNALLKILEEPPEHTVIILLTYNMYSLLSTIVSRCQVIKFIRASEKEIENYLINKKGVQDKEARFIAAFSDGIMKKALDYLIDDNFKKVRDEVIKLSSKLYKNDKLNVLSAIDYFLDNKDRIDNIFEIMISFFRDIIVLKECNDSKLLINLDMEEIIIAESHKYTAKNLYNILTSIKKASENIKRNINYQLIIETMLLNIQEG